MPTERVDSTADKLPLTLVHVREGRRCGSVEEFEGISATGVMVQPSQQHVAACVKGVEWDGDWAREV